MREVNRVAASIRAITACGVVLLAVLSLAACGGGGLSGNVIAKVGDEPITKPELEHWMTTMLGGDYYDVTSKVAPAGLLASPPGYTTCMAKLQAIAPKKEGKPQLTPEQIKSRCKQIYDAIKEQALNFLINAQINISEGAKTGVKISQSEIDKELTRLRKEQYPKPGALEKYLAEHHRTLADERFLLKLDLLNQKSHPKILQQMTQGGGGQQAVAKRLAAYTAQIVSKTDCRAGYVVARCRQYKPQDDKPYRRRSPASLLLEIGRWQPATSHGFTGPSTGAEDILCHNVGKRVVCRPLNKRRGRGNQ
jgi:flagellar motility protein MotE (MotC chaperone)